MTTSDASATPAKLPKPPELRDFYKICKVVNEWAFGTSGVRSVTMCAAEYRSLPVLTVWLTVDWRETAMAKAARAPVTFDARFAAEVGRDVIANVRAVVFRILDGELVKARAWSARGRKRVPVAVKKVTPKRRGAGKGGNP